MAGTVNPNTNVDHVGKTGIYPISGPWPAGQARVSVQGEIGNPPTVHLRHLRRRATHVVLHGGRLLYGGFFLYNGINHFANREQMVGYARSKGVPLPTMAVLGTGGLLLLGGLSLLTGARPKIGAALVTTFLATVSPMMHNFWALEDEQQRTQELINFTKNVALIGGAAFAASVPEPWPASPSSLGQ